ncbi:MAG: PAS domain S-box protein [Hydrogenophilales bacterium]|nr:PAS domain S-box protein [Hydrogenophilales bacterium]
MFVTLVSRRVPLLIAALLAWIVAGYFLWRAYPAPTASLALQSEADLTRELHYFDSVFSKVLPKNRGEQALQEFMPEDDAESRYFLLNRQLIVIAAGSKAAIGKHANTLFGPQVLTLLDKAGNGSDAIVSRAGNTLIGIDALRANKSQTPFVILLVQRDQSSISEQFLSEYQHALGFVGVFVFLCAGLLYLPLSLRARGRLDTIGKAVARFAEGDGAARVSPDGNDAIARLGNQFNNMAVRIGQERFNLAESEERLKFALHGSNAGIWDWRIDSGRTYYSPRWKSLLGFSEDELQAHAEEWLKRVHPDDLSRVVGLLNAHMSGNSRFFESEHRLCRKDQAYIWVLERGVALRDESGKPYRMVGALTDISRRKEVESALQRSEEAYRSVVNAVTQVLFRSDHDGRLTFLNPAWQRFTGLAVETSLSRALTDFVVAEDRERARGIMSLAGKSDCETATGELRLTTRDGGSRWFSLHARSLQDGHDTPGIAGLLTDIDALKNAQNALTRSNSERNTILDISPDGYVFVDRYGCVIYVNPAFLAMTGLASDQIIAHGPDAFDECIQALCDPSKPMPRFSTASDGAEQLLYLISPTKTILKWLTRHIRDDQQRLQAGVLFFRDVTTQVEIDRMKSEFLSTAAHELRTPMASIFGFSELLLSRDFDATTRHDLLQRIHRQTKNLINLVNELLDLARIEAKGGKSFKFKEQELTPIVLNTLASFYVPPETHTLDSDLPHDLTKVNVDAEKLQQALTNIFSNALKYSPGGGAIHVRSVRKNDIGHPMVGIQVMDQGIGMNPEQMLHIFDRFYRADGSGPIPGTGLGMCLVKEIMDIFDGQVAVSSTPGVGTEVTLWLPVVNSTSTAAL